VASQPFLLGGIGVAQTLLVRACAAVRPISARLEPVLDLRGFDHWFLHSYTFPSRLPGPGRLAVPSRPVVVGAAPTLTRVPGLGLPPASAGCCDSPQARPFHPHQVKWRLVAHDRPPVHTGALHHHMRDRVAAQPIAQGEQIGRRRPEARVHFAPATVVVRHTDANAHARLMHIERRAALQQPLRRLLLSEYPTVAERSPLLRESGLRAQGTDRGAEELPRQAFWNVPAFVDT
jgi:hypothetical protein